MPRAFGHYMLLEKFILIKRALDILDRAYLPALRNPAEFVPAVATEWLEAELGGKVTIHGEEFFLSNDAGGD